MEVLDHQRCRFAPLEAEKIWRIELVDFDVALFSMHNLIFSSSMKLFSTILEADSPHLPIKTQSQEVEDHSGNGA